MACTGWPTERLGEDPRRARCSSSPIDAAPPGWKMLCWDGTGLWVLTKRLEKGTFSWPRPVEPGRNQTFLDAAGLCPADRRVDLRGGKLRPWYERE